MRQILTVCCTLVKFWRFFLSFFLSLPPSPSLFSLSCSQKPQVLVEGAVQVGDLSEEVDEAQSCGNKPPGEEEEGYDADSESNPREMAKQEEGTSTHRCDFGHAAQLLFAIQEPLRLIADLCYMNLSESLNLPCILWVACLCVHVLYLSFYVLHWDVSAVSAAMHSLMC